MLSDKYGQIYAEYLKKFLDAYAEKGIEMWGITTGTDPIHGFRNFKPSSMGWLPEYQVNFSSVVLPIYISVSQIPVSLISVIIIIL